MIDYLKNVNNIESILIIGSFFLFLYFYFFNFNWLVIPIFLILTSLFLQSNPLTYSKDNNTEYSKYNDQPICRRLTENNIFNNPLPINNIDYSKPPCINNPTSKKIINNFNKDQYNRFFSVSCNTIPCDRSSFEKLLYNKNIIN